MATEVVTVGCGQCGVQNMNTLWETLCEEHQIGYSGQMLSHQEDSSVLAFFNESSNCYVPRCLIFDFDDMAVSSLRSGKFKRFFEESNCFVTGESAGTYSNGIVQSQQHCDRAYDAYRRLIELSNKLEGMQKISSIGGGCGSAFSVALLEMSQDINPKLMKMCFDVMPVNCATLVVEPYNALLNIVHQKDFAVMNVHFDNFALSRVCGTAKVDSPFYKDLNYLIAALSSTVTSSCRFMCTLNFDLIQLRTNMVPFPFMNHLIPHISTVLPSDTKYQLDSLNVFHITSRLFTEIEKSSLLSANTPSGNYVGCSLIYRGDVNISVAHKVIVEIKERYRPNFVKWTPGFKFGICPMPFLFPEKSPFARHPYLPTAVSLANSSAITPCFQQIADKFDTLFRKRAFIRWYSDMDVDEFIEARSAYSLILDTYNLKNVRLPGEDFDDDLE